MSRCVSITSSFIAMLFLLSVVGGVADAGQADGPRVESLAFIPDDPLVGDATIRLVLDRPLHPGSFFSNQASVHYLVLSDPDSGWVAASINAAYYDSISNTINIVLHPGSTPGFLAPVFLSGTGPTPVVGTNGLPLGAKNFNDAVGKDYVNTFIAP